MKLRVVLIEEDCNNTPYDICWYNKCFTVKSMVDIADIHIKIKNMLKDYPTIKDEKESK